jgi:Response regulator of the LytR/AlgR family
MIQLAICDDDKRDLTRTAELIKEWLYEPNKPEIKIKKFSSPFLLLDAVSGGETFDIFLLDILMPEMSGISLGEQLSNLLAEPLIVYLSSSSDYYPDAFRLYAFNYICKPVGRELLFPVLDKIARRFEQHRDNVFLIKTTDAMIQIPLHSLVYAELQAHVCHFHLADGRHLKSQYLRAGFNQFLAPILELPNFIKTHTSFVVNLNYSSSLTNGAMSLTTGAVVPVARSFNARVQQKYIGYWLKEEEHL